MRRQIEAIEDLPELLFIQHFRLNKKTFAKLCNDLRRHAGLRGSPEIPVEIKVLCALSFLATGSYQKIVGVGQYLTQRTTSRCIREVVNALNHSWMVSRWIMFPQTPNEGLNQREVYVGKKVRCLKALTSAYLKIINVLSNMMFPTSKSDDPNLRARRSEELKSEVLLASQITSIIFTSHNINRQKMRGTTTNMQNKAGSTDYTIHFMGRDYPVPRSEIDNIWINETKKEKLEYKNYNMDDDENWYGTMGPYLDMFAAFKLRMDELRLGHGTMPITKKDSTHTSFQVSKYGLTGAHHILLEGSSFPPERRSSIVQSLGPMTAFFCMIRTEDCGLERTSGGNNGEFDGAEHAVCSESGLCAKKAKQRKTTDVNQKETNFAIIKKNPIYIWLENLRQSDITLRVMKPWLQMINKKSLANKNMKLYQVGQIITKIMKEFLMYAKNTKVNLTNCGFGVFAEWICEDGLSTTYGKLQAMDWDEGLNEILFDHYSEAVMELENRQQEAEDETEYSSSVNTKDICMSSTIANTREVLADASTSKDSEIMLPKTSKKSKCGTKKNRVTFQKEKSPSKRLRKKSSDDEYTPGSLFQEVQQTQGSVEDESEPDVDIIPETPKKNKRVISNSSESKKEDVDEEEDYACMVASLAQAHLLVQTTGKISQSILVKDADGFINITSPGERGCMLVKLELYPFKDCVKLPKNQYWTKRTYSSLTVISSPESPAYNLVMKLRRQMTKDVMKIKNVKTEKKVATGWKSG
ncbi:unnamed protein product [Colias eurytheme]|nr:unnamed protein product [Colias eurytheme]